MHWNILRRFTPIFLAVLLIASPAHANVILPLWMLSWGAMFLALLPIIVIEAIVIWVRAGTLFWQSGLAASVGNLASTLIGIPVAVILHAMLRARVDDTPKRLRTAWEKIRMVVWHVPYVYDEEGRVPDWMWPGGCLVLMVPFFLASWLSEFWVAQLLLGDNSAWRLGHAIFEANLVTYGILAALLSALLMWCIRNPNLESASSAGSEPVSKPADPWRLANEQAKRGITNLVAEETQIVCRCQVRSRISGRSWRLANAQAKDGMTRLRAAETIIDRQRLLGAAPNIRRFEDAYDEKAA